MKIGRYEIKTHFDKPPIPAREMDWSAWIDGCEEGPVGSGATEAEAIADLKEQIEEEESDVETEKQSS